MVFVCQLNLTAAPVVPPLLEDTKLITFFVDPNVGPLQQENGKDWKYRTAARFSPSASVINHGTATQVDYLPAEFNSPRPRSQSASRPGQVESASSVCASPTPWGPCS